MQAKRRTPDLVPIRYGRMVSSPFAFYRGGAAIMAADLATTPRSGIETQLCGDAHLSNFGGFMTPERTHVFGLNDFDETRTGPWEWDVKRLATSFEVAARDRGFSELQREAAVLACLRAYTSAISQFAAMRNLDLWYLRLEADRAIATIARRSDPTYVRPGQGRCRQVAQPRPSRRPGQADDPGGRQAPVPDEATRLSYGPRSC